MKIKEGFTLLDVCGEHIVVAEGETNIDFNNILSLSDSASFLWENIKDKDFNVDTLATLLTDEYEVSYEIAKRDSQILIDKLLEMGIIA
uniref:PqqD family protein n=5 Tax=unclassified Prevotella TaxID=2638335 RepID=A0AB33JGT8_9BACT